MKNLKSNHGEKIMKRLSQGLRKYIRRQKLIIKGLAKDKEEEDRLVRELLGRVYKDK